MFAYSIHSLVERPPGRLIATVENMQKPQHRQSESGGTASDAGRTTTTVC